MPIVIPPHEVQASVVREVENAQASIRRLQDEMRVQIELLQERKRSLITAAVTGQFDVTSASGRGVA